MTSSNPLPTSFFDDVGEFHEKFGLPHFDPAAACRMLTADEFEYRYRFLLEEINEFFDAYHAGDLEGCFDAVLDLAWVALGTAHFMNLPANQGWEEVVRANMSKERAPEDCESHKRGAAERIRKPADWVAPRLMKLILQQEPPAKDRPSDVAVAQDRVRVRITRG